MVARGFEHRLCDLTLYCHCNLCGKGERCELKISSRLWVPVLDWLHPGKMAARIPEMACRMAVFLCCKSSWIVMLCKVLLRF